MGTFSTGNDRRDQLVGGLLAAVGSLALLAEAIWQATPFWGWIWAMLLWFVAGQFIGAARERQRLAQLQQASLGTRDA